MKAYVYNPIFGALDICERIGLPVVPFWNDMTLLIYEDDFQEWAQKVKNDEEEGKSVGVIVADLAKWSGEFKTKSWNGITLRRDWRKKWDPMFTELDILKEKTDDD